MPLPSNMQSTIEGTDSAWTFGPLPAGWYYVECTEADLDAPLKSGADGRKAQFTFQVAPGQKDKAGQAVRRAKMFLSCKHGDEWGNKKIAAILAAYGLTASAHESEIVNGGVILGYLTASKDGKYNELNGVKASDGEYAYEKPAGNSATSDDDAWD